MHRKKIIFIFFAVILFFPSDGNTQPTNFRVQQEDGPLGTAQTMNDPIDPCADPESPCWEACNGNCNNLNEACTQCLSNTQVPLDGGLLWLLLAGAGYGVKKIVDHRKKKG